MAEEEGRVDYELVYECPIRGLGGRDTGRKLWLPRSGMVTLEMAEAMTGDLNRFGVRWLIRRLSTGEVVKNSTM